MATPNSAPNRSWAGFIFVILVLFGCPTTPTVSEKGNGVTTQVKKPDGPKRKTPGESGDLTEDMIEEDIFDDGDTDNPGTAEASTLDTDTSVKALVDKLDAALNSENLNGIEVLARRVLKEAPRSVRNLILAADGLAASQNLTEAETLYREILKRIPQQPKATVGLAYILLPQDGGAAEAATLVETALKNNPNDIELLRVLSYAQLEQKKTEEGFQTARKVWEMDKKDVYSWEAYAYVLMEVGKEKEAKDLLTQGLKKFPQSDILIQAKRALGDSPPGGTPFTDEGRPPSAGDEADFQLGNEISQIIVENRPNEAKKILQAKIEGDDRPFYHALLGQVHAMRGDLQEADREFREAYRKGKDHFPTLDAIINGILTGGQPNHRFALEVAETLVLLTPDSATGLLTLMEVQSSAGMREAALRTADRITSFQRLSPYENMRMVRSYLQIQSIKKARTVALSLLDEIQDPWGLGEVGELLYSVGEIDKAQGVFEKALRKEPGVEIAAVRLATIYRKKGRFKQARKILKSAGSGSPGLMPMLLIQKGLLERDEGNMKEALLHLEKAFDAGLYMPELFDGLLSVYKSLGRTRDVQRIEALQAEFQEGFEAFPGGGQPR